MLDKEVDRMIKIGTEVPKADGGTRRVTKKVGDRIFMRTGVETNAQKYTTKNMINFAYGTISSGKSFTSDELREKFPNEYSQGGCVFSMTGGILELLDEVSCIKNGRRYEYIKK